MAEVSLLHTPNHPRYLHTPPPPPPTHTHGADWSFFLEKRISENRISLESLEVLFLNSVLCSASQLKFLTSRKSIH